MQLLIAGADLNVKDLSGNTPMARARRSRAAPDCVHALTHAATRRAQMLAGKANPAKKAEAEQLMAKFAKK